MENLINIKTNYKEVINEEKQGRELYFESIPNYNERQELKANGYRWNNTKKCWYKKIDTLIKPVKKMENLRMANDEEIEEIAKEQWESERMQEYVKKTFDFLITKDNFYIEVEKVNKISLRSTMWYDDETEGPEENEKNFIEYNLRFEDPTRNINAYLEEKDNLKRGCGASGSYDYNGFYLESFKEGKRAYISFLSDKRGNFIRYLTDGETKEYINFMEERKEKYVERLKKYYKRYSKHVHACGYWVNR